MAGPRASRLATSTGTTRISHHVVPDVATRTSGEDDDLVVVVPHGHDGIVLGCVDKYELHGSTTRCGRLTTGDEDIGRARLGTVRGAGPSAGA